MQHVRQLVAAALKLCRIHATVHFLLSGRNPDPHREGTGMADEEEQVEEQDSFPCHPPGVACGASRGERGGTRDPLSTGSRKVGGERERERRECEGRTRREVAVTSFPPEASSHSVTLGGICSPL
eukprot:766895-Hanusia_phi.AAC.3